MDFGNWLNEFFENLSPDLDEIYEETKTQSLSDFKFSKIGQSTASGALFGAIPVYGAVTIPADVLHLMRMMTVVCYGVGAIQGRASGYGNVLEKKDFAMVLARWAKVPGVDDVAIGKLTADLATKVSKKKLAKRLAREAAKRGGTMVGRRLAAKAGAKVGKKLATRFATKAATRWIPILSAVVSGGSNLIVCQQIAEEAEAWYALKLRA